MKKILLSAFLPVFFGLTQFACATSQKSNEASAEKATSSTQGAETTPSSGRFLIEDGKTKASAVRSGLGSPVTTSIRSGFECWVYNEAGLKEPGKDQFAGVFKFKSDSREGWMVLEVCVNLAQDKVVSHQVMVQTKQ